MPLCFAFACCFAGGGACPHKKHGSIMDPFPFGKPTYHATMPACAFRLPCTCRHASPLSFTHLSPASPPPTDLERMLVLDGWPSDGVGEMDRKDGGRGKLVEGSVQNSSSSFTCTISNSKHKSSEGGGSLVFWWKAQAVAQAGCLLCCSTAASVSTLFAHLAFSPNLSSF